MALFTKTMAIIECFINNVVHALKQKEIVIFNLPPTTDKQICTNKNVNITITVLLMCSQWLSLAE